MKFKAKIPLFIIALFAWIVIISSCANMGMPTGGPKDSIPPVLLETNPEFKELNFDDDKVEFTFSEYIQTDQISETLVISPPLKKRPTLRTKSKTLIVQFNEELKDSATYSMDFKNSVVDNNEKNPLENLRFSFSTGPDYDSLRVAGRVVDAFGLEPIEKGLVLLQQNLHDSAVFKVTPNYIAKTDEDGLFMIDNIAAGSYHLFALNDLNGDMLYNEGAEEIAFVDSILVPTAHFHEKLDTLVKGVDSMLVLGHTHFSPEPMYLRYFMEDIFEQYIETSERESRYKCFFQFNESVKDSFDLNLIGHENTDWNLVEHNNNYDSLVVWITDTTVAAYDSLYMELSYLQLDSAARKYMHKDTLLMKFSDPKVERKKKKKRKDEEEEEEPVPQFNWLSNLASTMELNGNIKITAPEPVASFDSTKIKLYLTEDTLETALNFRFKKEPVWRTYSISYDWEPETNYTLAIDSAACFNRYGISSAALKKSFETREEDYYGALTFEFSNVEGSMVVQLLKNSDEEEVLREKFFDTDGEVTFEYLAPDKYKVKVIYDDNGNGKWDTGSYQDRYQPEKVAYINEVIKLRSNWTENHKWDLTPDYTFSKNIRDLELEEKKRKEAEEKARKEKEKEQKNSMFKPGNQSGGINPQQY